MIVFDEPKEVICVEYFINEIGEEALIGLEQPTNITIDFASLHGTTNMVFFQGSNFPAAFQPGVIELVPVYPPFVRGDCNGDGNHDIADGVFLLNYLFQDGPTPGCQAACDANGDGMTDSSDAIYIFNYRFLDGPPPPAPFPECGNPAGQGCDAYESCVP